MNDTTATTASLLPASDNAAASRQPWRKPEVTVIAMDETGWSGTPGSDGNLSHYCLS